jgi:hypothetical protein
LSKTLDKTDVSALSRLAADIDLLAEGKATGFVRVPHSVHRSAYGWIPIPIVRIRNGDGPSVLMQAGNHGDEWEGQIGLGNLIRAIEPKDIKGRLVILPSANFPAAMAGLFPGGHRPPSESICVTSHAHNSQSEMRFPEPSQKKRGA